MEKKLNLQQRITKATQEIQYHQKELCLELIGKQEWYTELEIAWRIKQLKLWTNYLRNTCLMHGLHFSKMLL